MSPARTARPSRKAFIGEKSCAVVSNRSNRPGDLIHKWSADVAARSPGGAAAHPPSAAAIEMVGIARRNLLRIIRLLPVERLEAKGGDAARPPTDTNVP